jgi:TetR/AcrR family transcriptional repressor of mexJK operon
MGVEMDEDGASMKDMARVLPPEPELPAEGGVKREQIMAAAREIFCEQGYGVASMDAIARAAGVSKATVYAHFTGKEDLFGQMIQRACLSRFRGFTSLLVIDPIDPPTGLKRAAQEFMALILSPAALAVHRVRIFYEAGPERTITALARYLEAADAQGKLAVPDPWLAATQFIGMLKAYQHLRFVLGLEPPISPDDVTRSIDSAVARFLRAYACD